MVSTAYIKETIYWRVVLNYYWEEEYLYTFLLSSPIIIANVYERE
jgi:hypothetical protein